MAHNLLGGRQWCNIINIIIINIIIINIIIINIIIINIIPSKQPFSFSWQLVTNLALKKSASHLKTRPSGV